MAFQFSLATVLRVRSILAEREERMLQKILFEISQRRESMALTNAQIEQSNLSRYADVLKSLTGRQLQVAYEEIKELKETRIALLAQVEKLEQLRDKQIIVYESARRNREMLTDMRDEKHSAYNSEMARSEQKTLDDNYLARRGIN